MFAAPLVALLLAAPPADPPREPDPPAAEKKEDGETWRALFDGKTLDGWTVTDFGGQGEPYVEDGALVLPFGNDITGVTIAEEAAKTLPKVDYVLELEAKRVTGSDFFCGLTVPVWSPRDGKDSHASLILGGWGGGVVGLSSLDGYDASENPSTVYRRFENGRWYKVRLEVTRAGVRAALDGKELFAVDTRGKKVGTRSEVNLSKPLGLATYVTTGAVRGIRVRPLTPAEVTAVNEACDAGFGPRPLPPRR